MTNRREILGAAALLAVHGAPNAAAVEPPALKSRFVFEARVQVDAPLVVGPSAGLPPQDLNRRVY
ncbi:hypothetical protein [Peristeroidobacter soli]|jgi:hypothetical protein|uniref:hypothetical protein n=1 Tax=Peristeroidobacter soli TaxID=2497877 RepID=UPI00101E08EA|nr:hypothetical protein [Peristeroidobacter soli]